MALKGIEHIHGSDSQAIAITSVVHRKGKIWCGLTAGRYCLVPFDLATRKFETPVDIFPWVEQERPQVVLSKIHNALGMLDDGRLVIGEGILYTWDGIPFEFGASDISEDLSHLQERRKISGFPPVQMGRVGLRSLATFDLRCMKGGKIVLFDPETGGVEMVGRVPFTTYVQSMTVDSARRRAYGHTLGDAHFFVADLARGTVEDHGRISMFAFHNLVVAQDGVVYGAWIDMDRGDKLRVLRYDPAKGFVERLPNVLLDDPGPRVQGNRGVDQWLVHSSGRVFVGMAGNGHLYEFDPRKLSLRDLGLVGEGGRVTSMIEDEQGRIVFSAGFPVMGVGRYDCHLNRMEHFGPITNRYDKVYFHGAAYVEGRLFLAETDSGAGSLWEVPLPA